MMHHAHPNVVAAPLRIGRSDKYPQLAVATANFGRTGRNRAQYLVLEIE